MNDALGPFVDALRANRGPLSEEVLNLGKLFRFDLAFAGSHLRNLVRTKAQDAREVFGGIAATLFQPLINPFVHSHAAIILMIAAFATAMIATRHLTKVALIAIIRLCAIPHISTQPVPSLNASVVLTLLPTSQVSIARAYSAGCIPPNKAALAD